MCNTKQVIYFFLSLSKYYNHKINKKKYLQCTKNRIIIVILEE